VPTGKIYIGSAVNLYVRFYGHRTALRGKRHQNQHLQSAWNKHGEHAFTFTVLELVLAPFLLEREQYYLDKLKACDPKRGFNIYRTAGSPYGRIVSEETRRKMSESQKKRTDDRSRILTSEHRAAIGAANRGRKISAEHLAKLQAGFRRKVDMRNRYIVTSPSGENGEDGER